MKLHFDVVTMPSNKENKPDSKFMRVVKTRSSITRGIIIPYLFIAYPIAGLIIGWWLDKRFNTDPWLLLVFFIAGMVEAFREMMRIAKRIELDMKEENREKDKNE